MLKEKRLAILPWPFSRSTGGAAAPCRRAGGSGVVARRASGGGKRTLQIGARPTREGDALPAAADQRLKPRRSMSFW
jgi:hypothetical protein